MSLKFAVGNRQSFADLKKVSASETWLYDDTNKLLQNISVTPYITVSLKNIKGEFNLEKV